jgi:hypothetical protein
VLSDAVSLIVPSKPAGSPIAARSQPVVTRSSSVAAGPVRQSMAFTFSAAASSSPIMPAAEAETAK